jgi:voltage-gated potassium channel
MNSQIDKLQRHVIICGFGRIGAMLAQELRAGGADFVVLERDEGHFAEARALGYLCLHCDATDEAALRAAGVTRARCVAPVLPTDAANVFITLSARSLNPGLEIIARGELPSTESKLLQAGADHVVLPTHIGAERIAEMILYQETAEFIRGSAQMHEFEKLLHGLGLEIEVVAAAPGSRAIGLTIAAVEQEARGAFFIVQLNRREGKAISRPSIETRIESGDGIVLVGRSEHAQTISRLFEVAG